MKHNIIAEAYDRVAGHYDRWYDTEACRRENRLLATLLEGLEPPVLDLGCGTGLLLDLGVIGSGQYIGVDISSGMLAQAAVKHPAARWIQGDIEAIPLPDQSVRSVVSLFGALSYSQDPARALSEILRVLVKSGMVFLMFRCPAHRLKTSYVFHGTALPMRYYGLSNLFALMEGHPTWEVTPFEDGDWIVTGRRE